MERLSATVAGVESVDALMAALVQSLKETIDEAPEFFAILFELHTLAQRNDEIAAELAELHRRIREHLGGLLAAARDEGVIRLATEPDVVAEVLFSLADGLAMRMLAEPARDFEPALATAALSARALLLPA
jgi:hypothetical protein